MKLIIRRDQAEKKGIFGGNKGVAFKLFGQCQISSEEKALLDKYQAYEYPLTQKVIPPSFFNKEPMTVEITIGGLTKGITHETYSLGELLQMEEEMKTGCINLKKMLEVMASFGGEKVYDIDELMSPDND